MLQNIFRNMGDITKNLLIINVIMFLVTLFFETKGIDLFDMLGMHYPSAYKFRPYQIVTNSFIHGGFRHLLFNMLGLVFLGTHLERIWGGKKFLIFYLVSALGATFFSTFIDGIKIYMTLGEVFPLIMDGASAGASGAIFGLIAAYGLLFPNTEFRLYFLIPIKAKWFAIACAVYAIYGGLNPSPNPYSGALTGHFAHLGGMIFAFLLIQIWKKTDNQFY